uniref:BTB domain-containing protein n=1 Tax=Skeletonema marinoi TaxID=267567 RepID=A0A6T5STR7_9STRA|mmetsp:Transcript_969/g.1419  ORF Transcript_969/g.1419 Transcript_969/m.1419 type:complete len:263 (+) Transcript_969:310-1098(+)
MCSLLVMNEICNENTADVCFEVSSVEEKEDDNYERTKRAKTSTSFYAHRSILSGCAPMLAALFDAEDTGRMISAQIGDVKPDIFQYMLGYVYGGSVPKEELMTHAKDIINAADKYSIVNLKLEAEAVYLNSTIFTVDNAMDNLLYADAKNCALLKETVLDFLAENSTEAINNISFADFPGSVVKDLMIAFDRSKKRIIQDHCSDSEGEDNDDDDGEDYSLMRVSELRRKLDGKGLDVDGSREAMIEALKNSTVLSYAHDATD